jgi:capsular polysaccharide transport system permease protein
LTETEVKVREAEKPAEFVQAARPSFRSALLVRIGLRSAPTVIEPRTVFVEPEQPAPRRRMSPYLLSLIVLVALPAFAASLYFAFVAADEYVAETRFAVSTMVADTISDSSKSTGGGSAAYGGLRASSEDAYLIAAYIRSRACVEEVSRTVNLRELFRRPEADFLARLKHDASVEELTRYWRDMVTAYVDPMSGIVTVTVSAFRRDDSMAIANAILAASEKIANEVSERARADSTKLAEKEVASAQERVSGSLGDLRAFRESAGFIDPAVQAAQTGKLLEGLVSQRIRLQTEYQVSSRAMSPDAPTLRSTKARLDELDAQIAEEKAKLTSQSKDSGALANLLPKYEQLMVRNDFDEKLYELASDGLERARLRAASQTIYVNVFVPPAPPQDALYPERFASAAMVSLTLLILWGVGALTAALVQDHQL